MVILGIGVDIVENSRIAKLITIYGDKFLRGSYSTEELSLADSRIMSLQQKIGFFAKRFAAKEAFSKAVGVGFDNIIKKTSISTISNERGAPKLQITEEILQYIYDSLSFDHIKRKVYLHVSLSDEKDYSVAQVIIELN